MFVIATRGDLREEFSMADEAFALSPISARAALPSEQDYAAISEAFMETSRGRWFLGEYARRNRNADTSMVLDAVARIEQSLAAQKEESLAAQQQAGGGEAEARLAEALAAIRGAVEAAQALASEAFDALALEQKLAPVRKGARVIREISWRLREIGNDGRICDLIDSQVGVIEAGAAQISSTEAKAVLDAAFASIAGRLAEFSDDAVAPVDDAAVAPVAEAAVASAAPEMPPAMVAETIEQAPASVAPAQQVREAPTSSLTPAIEAELAEAEAALAQAEAAELAEVTDEAADAHDEAVLDLIAMEMGAPDPFDDDELAEFDSAAIAGPEAAGVHFAEPEAAEADFAEPVPVEPETARGPEPVTAPIEVRPQPMAEPVPEISLGSSLIASGLVRKRVVAANDPLAPIRRMSQAEKVAFFS
jgi:hypothetical protein